MNPETALLILLIGVLLAASNIAMARFHLRRGRLLARRSDLVPSVDVRALADALAKLKEDLPSNYVKREDWIRFGAVIDVKLDTMREQMEAIREKLYGQPQS
jgi:hypothetical protein